MASISLRIFWMLFGVYFILTLMFNNVSSDLNSCSAVKDVYMRKGFTDEVPDFPVSDQDLKFCKQRQSILSTTSQPDKKTCCTADMEHKLSVQSRQDFDVKLKRLLIPFADLLVKKHKIIDDIFDNLLNASHKNFDKIFRKTYGVMYLQNSYIFNELFDTFDQYYKYGKNDLQKELNRFFKTLFEKLFTVFNSQYIFGDDYLKCVYRHMDELKPFKNDPDKLTKNFKRSFVALRTFVQGLDTASSVVRNVLKANPSFKCLHELIKMTQCSTCAGHLGAKPCLSYCLQVQQMCLAHHQPFFELWTQFTEAMQKLGDRLEGPFNIGHEVPTIDLKISNAIMNFQEAGADISNKVFQGCGQPHLGRVVREASPLPKVPPRTGELDFETLNFDDSGKSSVPQWPEDDFRRFDEILGKIIREIKTKVKNSRQFWSDLPSQMCKEARPNGPAKCWTGYELGKYEEDLSSMNLGSSLTQNSELDAELFRLKLIIKKLKDAYHGRDVSWVDEDWVRSTKKKPVLSSNIEPPQDDEREEGSGSGWGSTNQWDPSEDPQGRSHYPPDDEDGYAPKQEGSGDLIEEGSGEKPRYPKYPDTNRVDSRDRGGYTTPYNPYDSDVLTPKRGPGSTHDNPSASPAEQPMTLTWAIAVYLLPAVFSFLGTIA